MFVRSLVAKVLADRRVEVRMATDLPGILIVDDNEDNRYTLQLMLESDGHEGSLARPVETRRLR